MKISKVGTIELGSQVTISDPCYEVGTWCAISLDCVLEGTYDCFIKKCNYNSWGSRVKEMTIVHKNYQNLVMERDYELMGNVGVDSGTMSITDTNYYEETHNEDEESENWYNMEVCEKTCDNEYNIVGGRCFISTSGIGDGTYSVYGAFDSEDRLYALKVVFL